MLSLRTLVSRTHGYSPYRLVFKCEPVFPDHLAFYDADPSLPLDIDALDEVEMLQELERIWRSTVTLARQRLAAGDRAMQREYQRRHQLLKMEIPHYFKEGDWVLLKQRRVGKLLPRAMGPYRFLRYKAPSCLTAELTSVDGLRLDCSSAHLIPYHPVDSDSEAEDELPRRRVRARRGGADVAVGADVDTGAGAGAGVV